MKCTYPLCANPAKWIPVIALPTIRTAGTQLVKTDRPTYLIFKEVCDQHRQSYTIEQCGLKTGDWTAIQDVFRKERPDLQVPNPKLITIHFMPLGWTPRSGYLELERTNDS